MYACLCALEVAMLLRPSLLEQAVCFESNYEKNPTEAAMLNVTMLFGHGVAYQLQEIPECVGRAHCSCAVQQLGILTSHLRRAACHTL